MSDENQVYFCWKSTTHQSVGIREMTGHSTARDAAREFAASTGAMSMSDAIRSGQPDSVTVIACNASGAEPVSTWRFTATVDCEVA